MKVLTNCARQNPHSLCYSVLERFDTGLREAGHEKEIGDLHVIGFDPVMCDHGGPHRIDGSAPDDVLAHMNLPPVES